MNSTDNFKKIIYFVCFGDRYKKLLNMCLTSLINVGKYDGDILIVTNFKKEDFIKYDKLIILENKNQSDFTYICNCKAMVPNLFDFSKYDFVMYLDNDVLINSDRLNSMITNWFNNKNKIFIQKDITSIGRNKPYCGSQVLSADERNKNKHLAFNAGVIAGCSDIFIKFFNKWDIKNKEHDYKFNDQGNLVFNVLRNFKENFEFTTDTAITNRKNDELRNETILHFLTRSEAAMYSYFEKYIKNK